jgi:hypothetical protein
MFFVSLSCACDESQYFSISLSIQNNKMIDVHLILLPMDFLIFS